MIGGAGRTGKTALSRNLIGESFDEHLESTIGINGFEVNVMEVGSLTKDESLTHVAEGQGVGNAWKKYVEQVKLLEGAVAKNMVSSRGRKEVESKKKIAKLPTAMNGSGFSEVSSQDTLDRSQVGIRVLNSPGNSFQEEKSSLFDEKDYEQKITHKDLNLETVKCLAENVTLLQSKYIISIYDYGGQEVFDAIHPYFLTKYGLYVVVFDMRQLVRSAEEKEKEECLKTLRFWMNSVSLHSYDKERREMAPIILVGTRKDIVSSPEDHEDISKVLSSSFGKHSCWKFVKSNRHGLGKKGNTTFCYFPISNKMGYDQDATLRELLQEMERSIASSHFMQKKLPLIWLKVMDKMKERAEEGGYLKYEKVLSIAKECEMSEKSIPYLLKFMHEMGLAMWHDKASLDDVIIRDPVKYFVTPATTIICKHVQSEEDHDATWHLLPIHEKCWKRYPDDWEMMLQYGFVSEQLFNALLSKYPQKGYLKELMLLYGLLLKIDNHMQEIGRTPKKLFRSGYLVPSLFAVHKNDKALSLSFSSLSSFFLGFYVSELLEVSNFLDALEMKSMGFLPNGFFARLLCKILSICLEDSPSQVADWHNDIRKDSVVLSYKGQRFRMTCHLSENMIRVDVFGHNPVPIYLLLSENIENVCEESFRSLKCVNLLLYPVDAECAQKQPQSTRRFIKLSFLEQCMSERVTCSLPCTISLTQLKDDYNVWLFRYKHSLPLSGYDIFLSYRWNDQDSPFVKCLFDEFSYYNLSSERYSPVSVFLDNRRLLDGEDFRDNIVSSLLQSTVIVPIITVEALKRLIHHNPVQIDNLLLEWILAIHLSNVAQPSVSAIKVVPLVFGSYSLVLLTDISRRSNPPKRAVINSLSGINVPHSFSLEVATPGGNVIQFKDVDVINVIMSMSQKILPEATLMSADRLLRSNGQEGLADEIKLLTVDQIVSRLLSFKGSFLSSDDLSSLATSQRTLQHLAAKQVERLMKTISTNFESISLITDNDLYFYNQERRLNVNPLKINLVSSVTSATDLISPISSVSSVSCVASASSISQEFLDNVLLKFSTLQRSHQVSLKFLLYQQFINEDEYDKAEMLINDFEGFDTSSAEDTVQSYQQRLQSFFPVGFDDDFKVAFSKTPKLLPYRKKINEIKQHLNEMLSDLQKPSYGIQI
jgi:GTPase SAR1 family protein